MSTAIVQLDAGGLLLAKAKVDATATEQIVARTYRHAALGNRPFVRLASDRLGQAEDLAMEFLGFGAPAVSAPSRACRLSCPTANLRRRQEHAQKASAHGPRAHGGGSRARD